MNPCQARSRVGVATGNRGKLKAALDAFQALCNVDTINMVDPPGGLPAQPVGREVFEGAVRRAAAAYEAGYDFGVGIEAGPIEFYTSTGWIEVQVAVIVGPEGRASVGISPGFEVEPGLLARMLEGEELGSLVYDRRPGDLGESIGYIGLLTRGVVTRSDLTRHAVIMALVPWASGWWRSLTVYERLLDR